MLFTVAIFLVNFLMLYIDVTRMPFSLPRGMHGTRSNKLQIKPHEYCGIKLLSPWNAIAISWWTWEIVTPLFLGLCSKLFTIGNNSYYLCLIHLK